MKIWMVIIRIVKSSENSNPLIDETTETIKHERKKLEGRVLPALIGSMAAS